MNPPFESESILERVQCVVPSDYQARLNETPTWARWLDGQPGFVRIKPEHWGAFNGQVFFDGASRVWDGKSHGH